MVRLLMPFVLLAGVPISAPAAPPPAPAFLRVIAGLPAPGTTDSALRSHAAWMRSRWGGWTMQRAEPMRGWAARELRRAPGLPVFYPFGGVDVPTPLTLFPDAPRYVLAGLEPVGSLPDWERLPVDSLAPRLAAIREAVNTLLAVGFLRTNDMKAALPDVGATPVLLALLVRAGATIEDVEFGRVSADGTVETGVRAKAGAGDLVRIRFRRGGRSAPQELVYTSLDLSDGGLARPGVRAWLDGFGRVRAMTKAASYLMHKPYFGTIRSFLLDRAELLVQDDSGIPYRYFAQSPLAVRVFGTYAGPIGMFRDWEQPDLRTASAGAPALPFGWGYKWKAAESVLLVAERTERRPGA